MRKIKIISDLHAGVLSDAGNDFKLNDHQLFNYLSDICETYDLLVINGDLADAWKPDFLDLCKERKFDKQWYKNYALKLQKEHFERIKCENFPESIKFVEENPKIIYITGNHDAIVSVDNLLANAVKSFRPHESIFITHGHQADRFNRKADSLGFFCTFFEGMCENLINVDYDSSASLVEDFFVGNKTGEALENYAYKLSKKFGYKIVVLAHTHKVKLIKMRNDAIYVNTGCCKGSLTFDEIDIDIDEKCNVATVTQFKFDQDQKTRIVIDQKKIVLST